jgi:protein-S-isoprenylcysteine O-methyltransferase Ste14
MSGVAGGDMDGAAGRPRSVSRSIVGWIWVAGQILLLVALVLLPGRDDWPTPPWLRLVAQAVFIAGIVVLVVASLRLGRALTPTPVPTSGGRLQTGGLYRFVRHPIYSGVLLIVVGITMRSGSAVVFAVAVAAMVFFDRKARWEEARLAERYPGYAEYASHTPRFVPRLR